MAEPLILHADMDAFYASVEERDDPSLVGKPVIIGTRSGRGVVLTANYAARPFGVGSAMPMAWALKRCPQAVVVPPNFEKYQAASNIVMNIFKDFSPKVEPLSLDEAFLDMSGAEHIFGPPDAMGRALKARVLEASGLKISVGLSSTKYVAKVLSDFDKPDGLKYVPGPEAQAFLAPLPVKRLWGAGPKTVERLELLGLFQIGDVARADPAWLERHLGKSGTHFYALAHARDPRPVVSARGAKSIGSERTLASDISDRAEILRHLRSAADDVAQRLRKSEVVARGVRVKLKTASFKLHTRQVHMPRATDLASDLLHFASELLDAFSYAEPFRLVGIAAFQLEGRGAEPQLGLFANASASPAEVHGAGSRAEAARDPTAEHKRRALETTLDAVRAKFGTGTVLRAEQLSEAAPKLAANLDHLRDLNQEDEDA